MERRRNTPIEAVRLWILLLALVAAGPVAAATAAPEPLLKQWVLADFDAPGIVQTLRHYGAVWESYPPDPASRLAFRLDATKRHGSRGHSLRLNYTLSPDRPAAIGFRIPLDGLDASDYDHLSFWVKGDAREGYASSFKIEFKRPDPDTPGLMKRGSFVVTGIGDAWRQIVVPLNFMSGIEDWSELAEFTIVLQSRRADVKQGAYFIDDIALIKTGRPGPSVRDRLIPARKQAWEASLGGQAAAKPHIQARLAGWPARALVRAGELPRDDEAFLWRLARDTWRGLDALRDRAHGLPIDHIRLGTGMVALEEAHIGDYTNVTNIGLDLLAVMAAHDLGFISKEQAIARIETTLSTLEGLETYRGFFYNYYDTTSLERSSHFISFVDSAWLTAGLMVARTALPELYARATRLIEQGDYGFFYDDVEQLMSHGYYTNLPYPSEYHYGLLYTEARLGSLIAIGKGDVPEEHWFRMIRTFAAAYRWQSQPPRGRTAKTVRGHEFTGGYYQWRGHRYVPSWGGSMFEALMPVLVLDERRHAPQSLGVNGEVHALLQRRYALKALGYPVWGLSPSATIAENGYSEYGVRVLGARGYKAGVVTPHAAALALAVAPQAAVANLRRLAERYDLYGDYGLYDAVDPTTGEVAYAYLALDQAMLFLALANHLGDGCVQRRFAADPIALRALPVIGEERFFD